MSAGLQLPVGGRSSTPTWLRRVNPTTPAQVAAAVARAALLAKGCRQDRRVGAALPRDDLRRSRPRPDPFGHRRRRLTYLGKSYGTLLGAVYADEFPTRVRALVLDGALPPGLDAADAGA